MLEEDKCIFGENYKIIKIISVLMASVLGACDFEVIFFSTNTNFMSLATYQRGPFEFLLSIY